MTVDTSDISTTAKLQRSPNDYDYIAPRLLILRERGDLQRLMNNVKLMEQQLALHPDVPQLCALAARYAREIVEERYPITHARTRATKRR